MIRPLTKKQIAARELRFAKQRRERGFSDDQLWNFDSTIARFLLPRLKRFKQRAKSYPGKLKSMKQWHAKLDEMIAGFQVVAGETWPHPGVDGEKIAERGLDTFRQYFRSLWD